MERSSQILNFIRKYLSTNGYAPSQREIADAVGLASASDINRQLSQLEEEGLIERGKGKARAIRVKDTERANL